MSSEKRQEMHLNAELKKSSFSEQTTGDDLPPYTEEPASQTLHARFQNWKQNSATITDKQTSTQLYNVVFKALKPNVILKTGADDTEIGTTSSHALSSKIDVKIHGHEFQIKPKKFMSCNYAYVSPTLNNTNVSWRVKWTMKGCIVGCFDEKDTCLARLTSNCGFSKEIGDFEFFGDGASVSQFKDETMLIGMTIAYIIFTMEVAAVAAA